MLWGLAVMAAVVAVSVGWTSLVGGAWSPTRGRVVRKMLQLAGLSPGAQLIDLGAGDGRILLAAAREFGARAVGIEIDPFRWALGRLRARLAGLHEHISVRRENFFATDLSGADVITMYLSQAAVDRLAEKLRAEAPAHCRIVSYRRPLPGWPVWHWDAADDVYVYVAGAVRGESPPPGRAERAPPAGSGLADGGRC